MTTSPLSFGDTFTLPITGDSLWEIKDIRPPFAHLGGAASWTAAASNTVSLENAFYTPEGGWHVSPGESNHKAIQALLEQLTVELPHKSVEDYTFDYLRLLGKETRVEVKEILSLADSWTKGTAIDTHALRAHIAASAACASAQVSEGGALYKAVYAATLATIKEQQA